MLGKMAQRHHEKMDYRFGLQVTLDYRLPSHLGYGLGQYANLETTANMNNCDLW